MPKAPKNARFFTQRSLVALKPTAAQVDYMAVGVEGFGIRVYPSGRKTFFVRYRRGRGFRRYRIGDFPQTSLKDARAEAEAIIGRVAEGGDPQGSREEERAAQTFGELAASYLEVHARQHKRTWPEDERILKRELLPAWRNLPAAAVRRRDIASLLHGIVGRGSPVMANRVRALVSRIFAFGLEYEVVEFNPVAGIKPPGEERKRERALSAEEMRTLWALWEAEGSVTAAVFRMLLLTGQRLGEVLAMRWADLDGDWWTVPSEVTKNKRGHRVYLCAQTQGLLRALRAPGGSGEWVFPSPRTATHVASVNKAVERFRGLSGIANWHPHDLRRTAATGMGDLEIPDTTIGLVLNHAAAGVTARYSRSSREREIANAWRLWGQRLEEIVSGWVPGDSVVRLRREAGDEDLVGATEPRD